MIGENLESTSSKPNVTTTVGHLIRRLLPQGSRPEKSDKTAQPSWEKFPQWPPDLFAVSGTLVDLSSCYSFARFEDNGSCNPFTISFAEKAQAIGCAWRKEVGEDGKLSVKTEGDIQTLWNELISNQSASLECRISSDGSLLSWCKAALQLMAISDEASVGMGFPIDSSRDKELPFASTYYKWNDAHWQNVKTRNWRVATVCLHVPHSEICVQPKTLTTQMGCTARSLSHHLALLPPSTHVTTQWFVGPPFEVNTEEPRNILLIPFPYNIDANCFRAINTQQKEGWGHFEIDQKWLPTSDEQGEPFCSFIEVLVKQAKREVDCVHAIILPELALSEALAQRVARRIAESNGLEMFVSGISTDMFTVAKKKEPANAAYTSLYHRGEMIARWWQYKHHSWRLDSGQIGQYSITQILDPSILWWEHIGFAGRDAKEREIDRSVWFYASGGGWSLATLICEDLARIDPVQSVVRAIGPNLLIVLLMDGPQLGQRWSSRYATVLADDPGSSVLTLTCLGMIRRSRGPQSQIIALWKDAFRGAQELSLAYGAHALLLTITPRRQKERTLDRRSDTGATTIRFELTGVQSIKHPDPTPGWI